MLAVALGMLLTAPAIFTGLQTEDWVQRALVASGDYSFPTKVNLYGHHGPWSWEGVERRIFEYRVFGWFPWLTYDRFDVSFWRPFASVTHLLDYRLWPRSAWVMHLQNVTWYGLLVGLAAIAYRRLCASPMLGGLAAIAYAVDDAHGHAVGWLANRNGVMATALGILSLILFDRSRREGSRIATALVPLCFGSALLCAEFALSVVGYFVAHAVFLDRAPWRRRLLGALTWLVPLGLWAIVYRWLGHAAHGSGLYVSPANEPATFAVQLTERATVLLASAFGGPPSDVWTHVDRYDQAYVVFAAATLLVVLGRALLPVLRQSAELRFFAAGAVLSVAPACAAFPEDRLLFFAGFGVMPVVAAFCVRALSRGADPLERPGRARALAVALVVSHGVLSPLALPYRTLYMHRYDEQMQREAKALFSNVTDTARQSIILVNARDFYFAGMMPLSRVARGESTVARFVTLAGTQDPVTVERLDERTVEVRPRRGFMTRLFNQIFRGRDQPMARGSRVDMLGVRIEVTEVDPWGEPLRATFEFALPLDTPRYLWIQWTGESYVPFQVPPIGETVVVRSDA